MTWNYRVMKVTHSSGEVTFGIHEVYYDDHGRPRMYSENPCYPYGDTLEELWTEVRRFSEALSRHVLTPDDFPNAEPASPTGTIHVPIHIGEDLKFNGFMECDFEEGES